MAGPRYLEKFTSLDGSTYTYTFPLNRAEMEFSQALRSPRVHAIGADYALRLRGSEVALRDVGMERIRCVYVGSASNTDTEIDNARSKLYLGALGKLWLLDSSAARR